MIMMDKRKAEKKQNDNQTNEGRKGMQTSRNYSKKKKEVLLPTYGGNIIFTWQFIPE